MRSTSSERSFCPVAAAPAGPATDRARWRHWPSQRAARPAWRREPAPTPRTHSGLSGNGPIRARLKSS
jgi:hypothetical protein